MNTSIRMLTIGIGTILVVALGATSASAQTARFRFTPQGGTTYVTTITLEDFDGTHETSGTGTEDSTNPSGSWNISWEVDEDGNITITCGDCGQVTTFTNGADQEEGSGSRKHEVNELVQAVPGTWINIDFI